MKFSAFLLGTVLLLISLACGGKKAASPITASRQGDRMLLELGQAQLEEKHWEDARGYFQQLLDTFPRSEFAGDARIGIADTYSNQKGAGNLVLAIAEYRDVLTFFPNHPRADYVQFRIGFAYYKQMHSSDRDQEPTRTAVEEFVKLVELYGGSKYADEGRQLLNECYESLAEHEFQVGRFYLKTRKACRGSIARLKSILEEYPTFSGVDKVYFHLGEAYLLCNSPAEAAPYYKRVIEDYPKSALKKDAEERLGDLGVKASEIPKLPQ
jgi:outer membrane protein assembly factor BamD